MCGTSVPDIYDVPNKCWFEWTNIKEFVNPPEIVLDKHSVIETSGCGASPETQGPAASPQAFWAPPACLSLCSPVIAV